MKKITVVFITAITGLLLGCAGKQTLPNSITPSYSFVTQSGDNVGIQLTESARSVSQSLSELESLEKASNPPIKPLPYPTASGLEKIIASVDWSGPIEPLLQRIAKLVDYKFQIIGHPPAIPILVTISSKNTPLSYVLRNADLQANLKANVAVYPAIQTIELRYAKN